MIIALRGGYQQPLNVRPRWSAGASFALLFLACATFIGCATPTVLTSPGGELTLRSQADPDNSVKTDFDIGFYSFQNTNEFTAVLIKGDINAPESAMTVRMFWRPRVARTPIDRNATNATVHYIVFHHRLGKGEEATAATGSPPRENVGIFSGAGFIYPHAKPGGERLRIGMWEATLRLNPEDATADFTDHLGAAILDGRFTLKRDEAQVNHLIRQLNVEIRQRLGFPRLVRGDE